MVEAPAKAAPVMLARRPSKMSRAPPAAAPIWLTAKPCTMRDSAVCRPLAATPIRSSKQRLAWATTGAGRSSNVRPCTKSIGLALTPPTQIRPCDLRNVVETSSMVFFSTSTVAFSFAMVASSSLAERPLRISASFGFLSRVSLRTTGVSE